MNKLTLSKVYRFFRIVILIALCVLLLDIVIGTLLLPAELKTIGKYYKLDAYYGHGLHAMRSGEMYFGDRKHYLATNSLGLKDKNPRKVDASNSKYRILLMGDSFTEGVGFSFDSTLAGFLQDKLDSSKIEILNGATGSYSTLLYYLKTKYLIEQDNLKFDEIIVLLDNSDLTDDLIYADFKPTLEFDLHASDLHAFYRYHSIIYNFIFFIKWQNFTEETGVNPGLVHYFFYQGDREFMRKKGEDLLNFHRNWPDYENDEWVDKGLNLMKSNLTSLFELCNSKNIKVTVVIYPWPEQLGLSNERMWQRAYWQAFCETQSVEFIDLFEAFKELNVDSAKALMFIPYNEHWSAEGHRFVADNLYKRVFQMKQDSLVFESPLTP